MPPLLVVSPITWPQLMDSVVSKQSFDVLADLRAWLPACPWPDLFHGIPCAQLHGLSEEQLTKAIPHVLYASFLYNLLHPRGKRRVLNL
jgi:hypothetical protein